MIQKKSEKKLTEEQKRILKQALWDMNLTPEEFLAINKGKIVTSV